MTPQKQTKQAVFNRLALLYMAQTLKENKMNLYKVTFVTGSKPNSMRVKAKNENLAWGYAKQYGLPSKVEPACSRWWYLIFPVAFLLGAYGAQML